LVQVLTLLQRDEMLHAHPRDANAQEQWQVRIVPDMEAAGFLWTVNMALASATGAIEV